MIKYNYLLSLFNGMLCKFKRRKRERGGLDALVNREKSEKNEGISKEGSEGVNRKGH